MPKVSIDKTLRMHYEAYDFTPPWLDSETVLLVHGMAESSAVWYGWIPRLAEKYKVVCIDLRGFGKSTIPPADYQWSIANFAQDINAFVEKLKLKRVHLVGAKLACAIALQFTHDHPEQVRTLTLCGGPASLVQSKASLTKWAEIIRERGLEAFSRATMKNRLGDVPAEMLEWWIRLYSGNSPEVLIGVTELAERVDLSGILPEIKTPTLMISGQSELLWSRDALKSWQELMPNCELVTINSNGYHIAAQKPGECVSALLAFLNRQRTKSEKTIKAR